MAIRSKRNDPRGVSMNIETSWAAQGLNSIINFHNMARFQQRQLMEKEQKLLQLYDQQQQRAHQVAQRGSAGSNTSNGSGSGNTQSITRTTTTTSHTTSNSQGGKVRQMFDERRQTTVKGIDRSYPLEPLENKPRKTILPSSQRNGNGIASRHSVTVKRTIRADNNGNVNNTKPVINYHEEVTRETFGPKLIHRDEDLEEFTNENDINKWTNGNDEINSEINNEISNQGRTPERTKYGNTRKETTITKRSETFNAPRIEKTPSPDQLRINSTERRSKNGGSGKNAEVISRPTSNESNRERLPDTPKLDSNDNRPSKSQENLSNNKKNSSAFVIDFEVEQPPRSKPNSITKKTLNNKQTPEKITIQQKSKTSSTRSPSALSTNSSCSSTNQEVGSAGSKGRMSMKPRTVTSGGNRTPSATKANNATVDSGLPACKICGRKFASDRISLHEQICAKTSQKKRKTFDPVVQRVKGTELEPFVKKISKKGNERKATKKPEVKSNWRRKHEDFINAIRSAKQMQAHLAAGGKLSDLPPPPASDTSDYIQCPHCGRKFNQAAAERHIPKCEHMLHNKPNPRAPPPKPRR